MKKVRFMKAAALLMVALSIVYACARGIYHIKLHVHADIFILLALVLTLIATERYLSYVRKKVQDGERPQEHNPQSSILLSAFSKAQHKNQVTTFDLQQDEGLISLKKEFNLSICLLLYTFLFAVVVG